MPNSPEFHVGDHGALFMTLTAISAFPAPVKLPAPPIPANGPVTTAAGGVEPAATASLANWLESVNVGPVGAAAKNDAMLAEGPDADEPVPIVQVGLVAAATPCTAYAAPNPMLT